MKVGVLVSIFFCLWIDADARLARAGESQQELLARQEEATQTGRAALKQWRYLVIKLIEAPQTTSEHRRLLRKFLDELNPYQAAQLARVYLALPTLEAPTALEQIRTLYVQPLKELALRAKTPGADAQALRSELWQLSLKLVLQIKKIDWSRELDARYRFHRFTGTGTLAFTIGYLLGIQMGVLPHFGEPFTPAAEDYAVALGFGSATIGVIDAWLSELVLKSGNMRILPGPRYERKLIAAVLDELEASGLASDRALRGLGFLPLRFPVPVCEELLVK